MSRPVKHPKTGIFMLRKRVPEELQSIIGKREEKLSLGTRDPEEAKRLHARELAELENRWAMLRSPERALSPQEIRRTIAAFAIEYLAEFVGGPAGVSLERRWPIQAAGISPDQWLETWPDDNKEQWRHERIRVLLEGYLANAGLRISRQTIAVLVKGLGEALDELAPSIRFRSFDGVFPQLAPNAPISSFIPAEWRQFEIAQNPKLPVVSTQASAARQASVPLSQLFQGWSAEKSPRKKTLYSWERVTKELESFLGHDDAGRISADDLIRWKASFVEKRLKPKTIRDGKLAPIRAILQWGVDNRKLEKNPAERVTIDLRAKLADRKRAYTDEEARTVLRAAVREEDALRKWVPLLCAYTGARVSEVCQLRTQDVVPDEGVWCVKFAPEAGALKNASSERSVPLHPWIIEQGFLEFVGRAKPGPLFPDVTPDRFGSRGGNGTKIIGRWVRALGIKDRRVSPNHSWRHRLRTLGRRYGLAVDMLDAITGHRRAAIADTYGGFPVDGLYREIRKIPALKLD